MRAAYEQSWNEQAYNEQYQIWLKNNKLTKKILNTIAEEIKKFRYKPKISIFMSIHKIDKKWLPLTIESVLTQIYPKSFLEPFQLE